MGKRVVPAGRRRRTGSRRGSGNRRGPARRLVLPVLALLTVALGAGAALVHYDGPAEDAAAPAPGATTATVAPAPTPTPRATTAKPRPKPKPKPKPKPRPTPPKKPKSGQERVTVPQSGTGRFLTARASGAPVGHSGTLRRYRVQVEEGVRLSAAGTAAEIQRVLAHPRGWAAHGRGRFQLVSENADFVIRIATPDTADALCRKQGLDTRGELNCETTEGVVVNLKRWMLGSPTFAGEPAEYRHLIINHEVGHEIGIRQHLGCPGPGRPAPAMMQQIKGLKGCRSNAFPYAEDGSYITGPIVP
ncbi:DUF3152 domain-containing protein [Streptomyces sp. NPDC094049]|uniref:DUF3152 domain-containing protein n=1 Tax=Streptomyces sp. NPDC094049 TaxID=3154987 RepID=UPI00331C5C62